MRAGHLVCEFGAIGLPASLSSVVKDPTIMYDPDERAEILKQYEDLLPKLTSPEVRARMIADGLDPEAELKKLADQMDEFVAADEDAEKAVEDMLQKGADAADANYKLFIALRQFLQELKQSNPLHPQLEEWEDLLDALAEQMPKEPEDPSAPPS
jgi:transposase-like protein